ncbi:hypothetical protein ACROYT_G041134 [Oculina patagonica]
MDIDRATSYAKQKDSLRKEFKTFLVFLPGHITLATVFPRDICRFLVFQDKNGKTQVHRNGCKYIGQAGRYTCGCLVRLSYKTVDSYIGKLRPIHHSIGRDGELDKRLGLGNPASDKSVKDFLRLVTAEQLQARGYLKEMNADNGETLHGFRSGCTITLALTAVKSCKELYEVFKSNLSQLVTLHFDSKRTSILCHFGDFGCGDGGWTPVMKIDGNKNTFHYNSGYWSDNNEYNLQGGETGFDAQETKLPSYWNTPFSKICLGMKIVQQINFIVINKQASSLYSLIADGQYRATSLGRNKWKTLIGSQASLQRNCNKEGFNSVGNSSNSKARIGILGNEQNDCRSCDSRIGFGTGGLHDDSNTCGNQATHLADNGNKHIKATGYILVE